MKKTLRTVYPKSPSPKGTTFSIKGKESEMWHGFLGDDREWMLTYQLWR